MRALEFITGHVFYNPDYTLKVNPLEFRFIESLHNTAN